MMLANSRGKSKIIPRIVATQSNYQPLLRSATWREPNLKQPWTGDTRHLSRNNLALYVIETIYPGNAYIFGLRYVIKELGLKLPNKTSQHWWYRGSPMQFAHHRHISAVLAIMLLFQFEGLQRATRRDLAVAWSPLVLLVVSIVEFLVGMICWYCGKNARWRGALVTTQFVGLLSLCMAISIWMWFYMKEKGSLGVEESQCADVHRRVADE